MTVADVEFQRERERRLQPRPSPPRLTPGGSPAFVGVIATAGNFIGIGRYITVNPSVVTGTETEGSAGAITTNTADSIVVLLVGSSYAVHGATVICRWSDYRWVTDVGLYPSCPIYVQVSNCFAANTGGNYQLLTITGSPTGGSFTLKVTGSSATAPFTGTTAAIAYNATADEVQSALEGISQLADNVTCTGGPLPGTAVQITFGGSLPDTTSISMTATSSLTGGGSPRITITTLPGNVPDGVTVTAVSNASQLLYLEGGPTGGTFTLSFQGQTTTPLAYNATNAQIQSALAALSTIGTGNVACSGGITSELEIMLIGALGGAAQPTLTVNTSGLIGGNSPSAVIQTQLVGGITVGPVDVPATGTLNIPVVCGSWTVTIEAPQYQTITTTYTPVGSGTYQFSMVPEDGYILWGSSNTPMEAPDTASLSGDPMGCSSLDLVSCTGGSAWYLGQSSTPGDLSYQSLQPGPGCCSGAQTPPYGACPTTSYSGQVYFLAEFTCNQWTLYIPWTCAASVTDGPDFLVLCAPSGITQAGLQAFMECLGNTTPTDCQWQSYSCLGGSPLSMYSSTLNTYGTIGGGFVSYNNATVGTPGSWDHGGAGQPIYWDSVETQNGHYNGNLWVCGSQYLLTPTGIAPVPSIGD